MSPLHNKMQTVSDSTIDKINHFDYRVEAIHKVCRHILVEGCWQFDDMRHD